MNPETADILQIEERIRKSMALTESHFREFKSALEGPPGSNVSGRRDT